MGVSNPPGAEAEPSAIPPLAVDGDDKDKEIEMARLDAALDESATGNKGSEVNEKGATPQKKGGNIVDKSLGIAKDIGKGVQELGQDLYDYLDERVFLREFAVYCLFLILFTGTTLTSRAGSEAFFFTDTMKDYFIDEEFLPEDSHILKKFEDVGTESEMWQFLQGPFIGNLLPTEDVNGLAISPERSRYVGGQTRIIGALRLRTIRMKPTSCDIADRFKSVFDGCYGSRWSKSNQDKSPYGPGGVWTYHSDDDLGEVSTWGSLDNYPGSGHAVVLEAEAANATAGLQYLKENSFVDDATRVVFTDFTVYNANVNLFCIIKLWFEYPGTGGAIPNAQFRTLRIYRYMFTKDYFVLFFELVLVLFVFGYMGEEVHQIYREKWSYFKDLWNYYDWVNLILFFVSIMFRIAAVVKTSKLNLKADTMEFVPFQTIAWLMQQEVNVNSFNGFLCWFKVFKYLKISKRLGQLTRTLNHATWDLLTFLVMFLIVLAGYTHMGFLAFGPDIRGFRNLTNSLITLFQAMIGSVDFEALDKANRFLGPLFYMTYLVLVFLIMMNMFLAIVNAAYTTIVLEDFEEEYEEHKKFDFTAYFSSVADKIKKRFNKETTENLVKSIDEGDEDKDNVMDKRELSKILETEEGKQVFEGTTTEDVMKAYDKDGDGVLNQDEQGSMKRAILEQTEEEGATGTAAAASPAAAGAAGAAAGAAGAGPVRKRPLSRHGGRRASRAEPGAGDMMHLMLLKLEQMDKKISGLSAQLHAVTEHVDGAAGGRGGARYDGTPPARPNLKKKSTGAAAGGSSSTAVPRRAPTTEPDDGSASSGQKQGRDDKTKWDEKLEAKAAPKSLGAIAGIPPP